MSDTKHTPSQPKKPAANDPKREQHGQQQQQVERKEHGHKEQHSPGAGKQHK
ncbi:hypothetical protein [Stenotrophomonas sp. YIM B06876]|uniref:hypothetical protein n=1 Tax=Stenotrophomonas sp. YIM B06876 TaxID=3060211 RepID=UPI0027394165|nr:hypothetical protein [Stenotrophomonas sp. YIM B06876]